MRVLPPELVPREIWAADTLKLPPLLVDEYVKELDDRSLRERSTTVVHGQIHGGESDEETLEHFALRFAASAGRVEYASLGPASSFADLSDALLTTFSEGNVALLDIPCGTGAGTVGLITLLIELRRRLVLPRLPLTVTVCAGDYSRKALEIFDSMMRRVIDPAAEHAIILEYQALDWDATRGDHTARLINAWLAATPAATEHVVLVTNFSGALHNQQAFDAFSPSLEQILSRLGPRSTVVWIEPATKSAVRGVLRRVVTFLTSRIPWFATVEPTPGAPPLMEAQYRLQHPVNATLFDSNVAIVRFDRHEP